MLLACSCAVKSRAKSGARQHIVPARCQYTRTNFPFLHHADTVLVPFSPRSAPVNVKRGSVQRSVHGLFWYICRVVFGHTLLLYGTRAQHSLNNITTYLMTFWWTTDEVGLVLGPADGLNTEPLFLPISTNWCLIEYGSSECSG